MKTNFKILGLALALCFGPIANAQEILTGFYRDNAPRQVRTGSETSLFLPFFDDFSQSNIYPDSTRWTDCNALVNDGFPLDPPTRNAATLDVLDAQGRVYDYAISNAFVAEYLTSARIRLDSVMEPTPQALSPADSVYFSFWYQPQGHGMPPEEHDSLVLQFGTATERPEFLFIDYQNYNIADIFAAIPVDTLYPGDTVWAMEGCIPGMFTIITDTLTRSTQGEIAVPCDSVFTTVADTTWYHIWSVPGQTLQTFIEENQGQTFRQVLIPIKNPDFFTDHFYFRFYNYASIENANHPQNRGNEDEWNIDFVYLNIGRNFRDTHYPKLAFSGQRPTFLNRYKAMPYRQYRANPNAAVRESLQLDIANLDSETHVANYHYSVRQINGNQHYTRYVDPIDIEPYDESGYLPCSVYSGESAACPFVGELFSMSMNYDSVSYEIKHYVYDSTCIPPLVDSMVYRQIFYNYYAYDDGIPEMGYGVVPAGGAFATRFELAEFDTIQGVEILFNHTLNNANDKYFDLVLWKDENGRPGNEIYRLGSQRPQWEEQIYKFHFYPLDSIITLAGSFFVGIVQQTSSLINIGFDASNDNSLYTFYNTNGTWQPTEMRGTLMIHPVVDGRTLHGVEEIETGLSGISLYPNPVTNTLNVSVSDDVEIVQTYIFDLTGRKVYQGRFEKTIAVNDLTNGLYLLSLTTANGQVINQKFIISK